MSDRDAELERICHAALDCPPDARANLLAVECRGDDGLRRDVERLLAFETAAGPFLERRALAVPSRVGAYDITSVLGIGGMGEVYGGRDTVLDREVAVKVLPRGLAADPERLARLLREARVLASLNHPNVAQIYGVEQGALVMERVHGRTLATPMPVADALHCAQQIAAALEVAHEKGIVHRDLKPTNVMTTADGTVKVLDFGLAAVGPESLGSAGDGGTNSSPTPAPTHEGAIMGTPPFMSPEQAAGRPVDKRTDIWSFGVVLWELLTGRRLFEGETAAVTLRNVQTASVDMSRLPSNVPVAVRDLLTRCLDRDPRTRLRDIGEARILLGRALSAPSADAPRWTAHLSRAWPWAATALLAAAVVGLVVERRGRLEPQRLEPVTFQVSAPAGVAVVGGPALSPDGRHLVFTASDAEGGARIWVHTLSSAEARPLEGTAGAFDLLFWSPDSRFVGFAAGMELKKVAVDGGPPATLCERCGPASLGSRVFRGGTWNAAGTILYAISSNGLWRVPDTGGTPTRVTPAGDYGYPAFLPDGSRFLYTWFGLDPAPGVYLGDLRRHDEAPARRLADGAFVLSTYAPGLRATAGHLLALREAVLTAQAFDADTATLTGEPIVLAQNVPAVTPPAAFSASSTGVLAFSSSASADRSRVAWFDRSGRELGQLGPRSYGSNVSISPNGAVIGFDTIESDRRTRRVWTADAITGVATLVTTAGPQGSTPAVAPDGAVAFARRGGLFVTRASTTDEAERLYTPQGPSLPNDWSADGRFLAFNTLHPSRRSDLHVLRAETREAIPLLVTDADELPAIFSPDGRWFAYASDETGTREVYVRDFAPDRVPAVGAVKVRVSTAGGDKPRWRRDGTELYYIAADGRLMAVSIATRPTFRVGPSASLFELRVPKGSVLPYDVAPDGRFLINMLDAQADGATGGLTVVLNWNRLAVP